jgi:hypothetical protein
VIMKDAFDSRPRRASGVGRMPPATLTQGGQR